MDKNKVILYGAIAVGAYLLYQWLQSNGYLGTTAAQAATAPAQPATTTTAPTTNAYPSVFVQPPASVVVAAAVPAAPAAPAMPTAVDMTAKLTAAAAKDPFFIAQGGQGTSDQWNYYRNQIYGQTAQSDAQLSAAFPAAQWSGKLMSVGQFVSGIGSAGGLGAIVSVNNIPSMNFGTGAGGGMGAFSGKGRGGFGGKSLGVVH